jgi:hypothetical protein
MFSFLFSRRGRWSLWVWLGAGIRVTVFAAQAVLVVRAPFRWHPRYAFVLQASPLCGAAPTFLCRRKEK